MFGRATNYPICEGEEEEEEEWDRREAWEVREGDCSEVIKNNVTATNIFTAFSFSRALC